MIAKGVSAYQPEMRRRVVVCIYATGMNLVYLRHNAGGERGERFGSFRLAPARSKIEFWNALVREIVFRALVA